MSAGESLLRIYCCKNLLNLKAISFKVFFLQNSAEMRNKRLSCQITRGHILNSNLQGKDCHPPLQFFSHQPLKRRNSLFSGAWVHSGSLSWLYICVHNTITKCHAVASHPEVSSFRLLYWSEVKNFTMASCKREMTTCFGVKSVCKLTGMGGTRIMFPIWFTHVFYQHVVYIQITKIWNDPSSYKHNTKSKRHPGMKLGPVQFCHVNNP